MSEDSAISRRTMITGLGVSAGAIATSGIILPEAAAAAPGSATAAALASPESLVTTPGLAYTALSAWDLRPEYSASVTVGTYGAWSNNNLVARLDVPNGAILREIDLWGRGLSVVDILRTPHDSRASAIVKRTFINDTGGWLAVREPINDEPVNLADYNYVIYATAPTSTTGINAVRVGYSAPRTMIPLVPIARVLDTRSGARLAAGSDTVVPLGLPAGARSAIVTLTVTETTGASGYVGVYPAEIGATWPGNSNINWFGPQQNLATGTTTAVGSFGAIILHVGENATHVVVDVQGYLT